MTPSNRAPTVWREGDLVVVRRGGSLPPICVLSGKPATGTVRCYFHRQERPISAPSPLGLLYHYWKHVSKATIDLPMADDLLRARRIGWALFAMAAALAITTVAGLFLAQTLISRMPAGSDKRWWNDLGVPIIAFGGFAMVSLAAYGSYRIMPMPTRQLKVRQIDPTHIRLSGASPEYLAQLTSVGDGPQPTAEPRGDVGRLQS